MLRTFSNYRVPQIYAGFLVGLILLITGCGGSGDSSNSASDSNRTATPYSNGYILVGTESTYTDSSTLEVEIFSSDYNYNFNERLVTVSGYDEQGLVAWRDVFRLNDDGSTSHFEYYEANGGLYATGNYLHNDQGLRTERTRSDGRNRRYTYGNNNKLAAISNYNQGTGIVTSETVFSYDASGNLASMLTTTDTSTDNLGIQAGCGVEGCDTTRVRFTTNASGHVIRSEELDSEEDIIVLMSFSYDENGNMVRRTTEDYFATEVTSYRYEPTTQRVTNFRLLSSMLNRFYR